MESGNNVMELRCIFINVFQKCHVNTTQYLECAYVKNFVLCDA